MQLKNEDVKRRLEKHPLTMACKIKLPNISIGLNSPQSNQSGSTFNLLSAVAAALNAAEV